MKKTILLLGIIMLASCVSMETATYYHIVPQNKRDVEDVGKITYVMEKHGYSIITTEYMTLPVYVSGKLKEIKKPYDENAYIWTEKRGSD